MENHIKDQDTKVIIAMIKHLLVPNWTLIAQEKALTRFCILRIIKFSLEVLPEEFNDFEIEDEIVKLICNLPIGENTLSLICDNLEMSSY